MLIGFPTSTSIASAKISALDKASSMAACRAFCLSGVGSSMEKVSLFIVLAPLSMVACINSPTRSKSLILIANMLVTLNPTITGGLLFLYSLCGEILNVEEISDYDFKEFVNENLKIFSKTGTFGNFGAPFIPPFVLSIKLINELILFLKKRVNVEIYFNNNSEISNYIENNIIKEGYKKIDPINCPASTVSHRTLGKSIARCQKRPADQGFLNVLISFLSLLER